MHFFILLVNFIRFYFYLAMIALTIPALNEGKITQQNLCYFSFI